MCLGQCPESPAAPVKGKTPPTVSQVPERYRRCLCIGQQGHTATRTRSLDIRRPQTFEEERRKGQLDEKTSTDQDFPIRAKTEVLPSASTEDSPFGFFFWGGGLH